jgi:DNA-binding transcriptional MocR family regulator
MAAGLESSLGDAASSMTPAGGFFFWVRLAGTADTGKLLSRARAGGVTFVPGSRFSTCKAQGDCLRLSFSYYDEEHIAQGVARLAAVLLQ